MLQSPQHIALLPDCTSISQTANHKTSCSSVNQRKHYLLVAHHKECQVCLQLWDTANNPTIFVFAHFRTGDKHPQGTYQKGNLRSATWPPSRLPPPGEVTIFVDIVIKTKEKSKQKQGPTTSPHERTKQSLFIKSSASASVNFCWQWLVTLKQKKVLLLQSAIKKIKTKTPDQLILN